MAIRGMGAEAGAQAGARAGADAGAAVGSPFVRWMVGGSAGVVVAAALLLGRPGANPPGPSTMLAAPPLRVAGVAETEGAVPRSLERPPPPPQERAAASPPASPTTVTVAENRPSPPPQKVAPPRASSPSLSLELAAIDGARTALDQGDAKGCLGQLDAYERSFPRGVLRQEATVMRIDALLRARDHAGARSLGDAFLAHDPTSPYSDRIRHLLADDPSNR